MKLLLATNNAHKAQEIRAILKDSFTEIVTMRDAGIEFEVEEDGLTFRENALKKAVETLAFAGDRFDAVLADDSGLCVDALDGAPGVYSARFSGEAHNDAANNAKLTKLLENVPDEQRTPGSAAVLRWLAADSTRSSCRAKSRAPSFGKHAERTASATILISITRRFRRALRSFPLKKRMP